MPAPEKDQFFKIAKTTFISHEIKLPLEWKKPGEQFNDAFASEEIQVNPNPAGTLFFEATHNKYHVDTADQVGQLFEKYIEGISSAICSGIAQWLTSAVISNVSINGPAGAVSPGCVLGSNLTPLIMCDAPQSTAQETKYSLAISQSLGNAWKQWSEGLSGTFSYPTFAAFPAAIAPPTSNVPITLGSLSSAGEAELQSTTLRQKFLLELGDNKALHAYALFDSIAKAVEIEFEKMKNNTMIQNVIGTGPVPSYSPPAVTAGPVVGGNGNGAPGCIA